MTINNIFNSLLNFESLSRAKTFEKISEIYDLLLY